MCLYVNRSFTYIVQDFNTPSRGALLAQRLIETQVSSHAARTLGCIVWYFPDRDQLHQNGYYVEPNPRNPVIFDLPLLSQQYCQHFLHSQDADLVGLSVPKQCLSEHFTEEHMGRLFVESSTADALPLFDLLKTTSDRASYAGACVAAALDWHHRREEQFLVVIWSLLPRGLRRTSEESDSL
jgi:hypothetical protein